MYAQVAGRESPRPGEPPNNWFKTLRDAIVVSRSTEGSTEDLPRPVTKADLYCGSTQKIRWANGTEGSWKTPDGS